MMTTTQRSPVLRRSGALLATLALAAAGLATGPAAQAAPGPTDVITTANATPTTLGLIPDATATGAGLRTVEIPVAGVAGRVTDVRLSLGLTHTYAGDVAVVLVAPDGTTASVVARASGSNDYAGTYTFVDGAVADIQTVVTNPVPSGSYQAGGADRQPSSLTAPLRGIASPSGTWRVRVADTAAGDTGQVTSASLTLATPRSATLACTTATTAATAAATTVGSANLALAKARTTLKAAKKSTLGKAAKAAKVKKAAKKVKKAGQAATTATAALATATATRTASC